MKHDTVMDGWLKGRISDTARMAMAENPDSASPMMQAIWLNGWGRSAGAEVQQTTEA